ncbi:MAG TPA: hypothetical protein VD908_16085 [Cytophagales bacterium]|nr:hypothetical protein [Cytophagales bacterium]
MKSRRNQNINPENNPKNFSEEEEKEIMRSDATLSNEAPESEVGKRETTRNNYDEPGIPNGSIKENRFNENDDLFEDYEDHEVL